MLEFDRVRRIGKYTEYVHILLYIEVYIGIAIAIGVEVCMYYY